MGVVARTTWEGPAIEAKVTSAAEQSLLAAGSEVQVQMRTNISAKKGPSKGGEFPGYQTRNLSRSVTVENASMTVANVESFKDENNINRNILSYVREMKIRIGSPVFYGKYLEYGTSRMAPRPWVVRSFMMAKDRAKARFDTTMRRLLGGGQ